MTRAEALNMAVELVNARFAATNSRGYADGAPKPHEWTSAVLALAGFLLADDERGEDG